MFTGGRKVRVALHPELDADELEQGSEVVLNESLNVVLSRGADLTGEVVTLKEVLDSERALIVGRADEERVAELAERLKGERIRSGDTLLMDPRSGLLLEKLPQAVGKDLKVSPDAANYLDNPKEYVFSIMLGSYVWLDNILYLEELARRGKTGYGDPYYEDLARRVGPILRDHVLSPAAEDAGSYWYTAWTVAGRPELK